MSCNVPLLIKIVEQIEGCVSQAYQKYRDGDSELPLLLYDEAKKAQFRECVGLSTKELLENVEFEERVRISLRLWAGCLSAAKEISTQTMDGLNDESTRRQAFKEIDIKSDKDSVFRRGEEIAPLLKVLRGQINEIHFGGADNSAVLRYGKDCEEIKSKQIELDKEMKEFLKSYFDNIKKREIEFISE